MARGYPDYLNTSGQISIKPLDTRDLFELGFGIQRLDGRGDIVFADNWRDGLSGYIINNALIPGFPQIYHVNALLNTGSLYFVAPAGSGTATAYISKRYVLPARMRVGYEFAFRHQSDEGGWRLVCDYTDAPDYYQIWLDKEPGSLDVRVRTPDGYQVVKTLPAATFNTYYMRIKAVGDFITGKYDRLIVGDEQIDLRDYELYHQTVSTGGGSTEFTLSARMTAGSGQVLQVGYLILTTDEP